MRRHRRYRARALAVCMVAHVRYIAIPTIDDAVFSYWTRRLIAQGFFRNYRGVRERCPPKAVNAFLYRRESHYNSTF
jgi:hypothetical protein